MPCMSATFAICPLSGKFVGKLLSALCPSQPDVYYNSANLSGVSLAVTQYPGLYFLGLKHSYAVSSTPPAGVGNDVAFGAEHMAAG
jgi:hypothetical protein